MSEPFYIQSGQDTPCWTCCPDGNCATCCPNRTAASLPDVLYLNLPACLGPGGHAISIPLTKLQNGLYRSITTADNPGNPVPAFCNGDPVAVEGEAPYYWCNYAFTFTVRHGIQGVGDCLGTSTVSPLILNPSVWGTGRPAYEMRVEGGESTCHYCTIPTDPIELQVVGLQHTGLPYLDSCTCAINLYFTTDDYVACRRSSGFPSFTCATITYYWEYPQYTELEHEAAPLCCGVNFCRYLTGDITTRNYNSDCNCDPPDRLFTYGRYRHNPLVGFSPFNGQPIYHDKLGNGQFKGFVNGTVISCDPLEIHYTLPANICFDPTTSGFGPTDNFISCTGATDARGQVITLTETAAHTNPSCPSNPCEPPPTFNCVTGTCVDPMDGTGTYASRSECVAACVTPSWNCVSGACVDPENGTGTYATLGACEAACLIPATYNCVAQTCVDPRDGSGTYATLFDCLAGCPMVDVCPTPPCGSGDDGGTGGDVNTPCCGAVGHIFTIAITGAITAMWGLPFNNGTKVWASSFPACGTFLTGSVFCSAGETSTFRFKLWCGDTLILDEAISFAEDGDSICMPVRGHVAGVVNCGTCGAGGISVLITDGGGG